VIQLTVFVYEVFRVIVSSRRVITTPTTAPVLPSPLLLLALRLPVPAARPSALSLLLLLPPQLDLAPRLLLTPALLLLPSPAFLGCP
jgi:hypothetical protein